METFHIIFIEFHRFTSLHSFCGLQMIFHIYIYIYIFVENRISQKMELGFSIFFSFPMYMYINIQQVGWLSSKPKKWHQSIIHYRKDQRNLTSLSSTILIYIYIYIYNQSMLANVVYNQKRRNKIITFLFSSI